jgi:hypothetical protein
MTMSPRKTILRELSRQHQEHGSQALKRPSEIPDFGEAPEKYQSAVNRLLQERLIEGRKDGEGRMALALNDHRIGDVKRELRPFWARPAMWAALVLVAVVVGAGFAI